LIRVHKASTQNQKLRTKTSKISMSQRDNRKSCHSDQLSLNSERLRGLIWGTKLHVAARRHPVNIDERDLLPALGHPQYPSLNLRHGAFGRLQVGLEERVAQRFKPRLQRIARPLTGLDRGPG
jgi:hypothetical protein